MIKAKIPGTNPTLIKDKIFIGPGSHGPIIVASDDRLDYSISTLEVDTGHHRLMNFGKIVCTEPDITINLDYPEYLRAWMVLRQATSLLRLAGYANRRTKANNVSRKNPSKENRETISMALE